MSYIHVHVLKHCFSGSLVHVRYIHVIGKGGWFALGGWGITENSYIARYCIPMLWHLMFLSLPLLHHSILSYCTVLCNCNLTGEWGRGSESEFLFTRKGEFCFPWSNKLEVCNSVWEVCFSMEESEFTHSSTAIHVVSPSGESSFTIGETRFPNLRWIWIHPLRNCSSLKVKGEVKWRGIPLPR